MSCIFLNAGILEAFCDLGCGSGSNYANAGACVVVVVVVMAAAYAVTSAATGIRDKARYFS